MANAYTQIHLQLIFAVKIPCCNDVGLRPHQSLSDLLQDIKGQSSKWFNEKKFTKSKFQWQEGYGAFSYSHSHIQKVVNYIRKQEGTS